MITSTDVVKYLTKVNTSPGLKQNKTKNYFYNHTNCEISNPDDWVKSKNRHFYHFVQQCS